MIDAILYAVRDGIRHAGFGYGIAECEITDDGKPPPRAGNVFVSVHNGRSQSSRDNQLMEEFGFSITLTMRVVRVALDRIGDQLIARNIELNPIGTREGFNHKLEQLRAFLHMNWKITIQQDQYPKSANDNLASWSAGTTVFGFVEPMRYQSSGQIQLVGSEWFSAAPGAEMLGVKSQMEFGGCKRMQPQTAAVGPFV